MLLMNKTIDVIVMLYYVLNETRKTLLTIALTDLENQNECDVFNITMSYHDYMSCDVERFHNLFRGRKQPT